MKPKIVSWNVCELNEINKRQHIKKLLREWRADIVCFQEINLKLVTRKIMRGVWSCPYVDWVYLASNGASGGILVIWDKRVMEKIEEFVGDYTVACSFKMVEDDFLFPSERSGDSRIRSAMTDFSDYIFYLNLIDLPFT
ncbi:hypothetical protein I3760_09G102600 [Carya illinoinensis]|nr:hypothetical protein I3760_09G102600 [Carya illinoinensis]